MVKRYLIACIRRFLNILKKWKNYKSEMKNERETNNEKAIEFAKANSLDMHFETSAKNWWKCWSSVFFGSKIIIKNLNVKIKIRLK